MSLLRRANQQRFLNLFTDPDLDLMVAFGQVRKSCHEAWAALFSRQWFNARKERPGRSIFESNTASHFVAGSRIRAAKGERPRIATPGHRYWRKTFAHGLGLLPG